ncbi:uncharacterized protein EDB93DRAFT_1257074 [Suillus bovinus]|uniref:uncharacterized protein n=1 Tax=Suillus bovinus TaxID=48563 RepID=UPI001B88197F|nr:uncharacterized protein EDB93DRAFT_1257074 [Suillus bovinus]KAG2127289.1 hypothetical protein EDB93DRAFT_1257074 [Suillus bovinus]
MVNDIRCLACSATFGSRKQLAVHTSQCALNIIFTDQIFDRKRKLDKKKRRQDKRVRCDKSPERIPGDVYIPEQPGVQDPTFTNNEDPYIDVEMARPPSPSPPPINPVVSQCSGRKIRMPARFADFLPGSATHLAHMPPTARQQRRHDVIADQHVDQNSMPRSPSPETSEHEDTPPVLIPFQMEADDAGLYRIYITRPSNIPNNDTLEAVTDAPTLARDDQIP